jgi:hypothetical protein
MAHWKLMTDRKWIYAFDLGGKDRNVRIVRVEAGTLEGLGGRKTKKPCVYFDGNDKPLALNATNAKTIAALVGSNDTDEWIGKWVTLYPTTCQGPTGETVECIRIRPRAPRVDAKQPDPPAPTEQPS